jgi:SAM-dependent methyltransferase
LTPLHIIADIGSGTGISSEMFIENGNEVYAIEPNREMRIAAESLNKDRSNFISRDGTGECTGLPASFIDFIICAQTFHWLDAGLAKKEFWRILKPEGKVILLWNERSVESDFQKEYEETLYRCVSAYKEVTHRDISEGALSDFFAPHTMARYQLPNFQDLDLKGLIGRMMSSSYIPKEGEEHDHLVSEITQLFHSHQVEDKIRFEYTTSVYVG